MRLPAGELLRQKSMNKRQYKLAVSVSLVCHKTSESEGQATYARAECSNLQVTDNANSVQLQAGRYFLTPPGVRVVQRRRNFPAAGAKKQGNKVTN